MGELDQFLATLPAEKREAARANWLEYSRQPGATFQVWAQAVQQKYPQAQLPSAPADVTATQRPNLPMMAEPSTIGRDMGGPMVPLNRLEQPGPMTSAMYGFTSQIPFADEAAAAGVALLQGNEIGGPEYETTRRAAEYQMGRAQREHPSATLMGQTVSTVGQILAMPSLSAEQMAAQGPGRIFARSVGEGAALGGVHGAGASDPGAMNRLWGGTVGAVTGGAMAAGTSALGEAVGGRLGTAEGRRVRNMADAGDASLPAARQILNDAPAEYPTAMADLIGPTGVSRLRSIATTPNEGQGMIRSFFGGRSAGRPSRVAQAFEDAAGNTGVNPLARRDALLKARQQEAEKLFDGALKPNGRVVILPSDRTAPLLRIPRIKQLIDEFRAIRASAVPEGAGRKAVQTHGPGLERVTAEELHYVKRRLAELGEGAEPGGAAATQAVGHSANSIQGAVENVLNQVPGYRQANLRYAQQSRFMDADKVGRTALQGRPDEVEYALDQMTPDERGFAFRALPSSVNAALETGSARGSLGRLGLGQTPRLGRQRIIDRFTDMSPNLESRLEKLVGAEERGMISEAAALTTQTNSHTTANLAANAATVAEQGVFPSLRKAVFRSLRDAPNAGELARDAEVLTATGARLRQLLGEAETANARRGVARKGFDLLGRAGAMMTPVTRRNLEMATRSTLEDEFRALLAQGLSEAEAIAQLR